MIRVMVFIDGSNLYHSLLKECKRTAIDFEKFCRSLCGPERYLVKGYYYNAVVDQEREPEAYRNQQKFLYHLGRTPNLEVKIRSLVYRQGPQQGQEKGIDVLIATDMLVHAARRNYDVAILVSDDTDFADAVQAVKDFGRNVEVALFGERNSSRRLRDVADRVIPMNRRYFDGLWLEG